MKIAVTGATGFLGRYTVRQLTEQGHDLRCWYRPTSDRTGFEAVAGRLEWLPGQLGDGKTTAALVQGMDAIVHSGLDWRRQGGGRFSGLPDQEAFLESNLMGSLGLFQAAHQAGVPRFVFIQAARYTT